MAVEQPRNFTLGAVRDIERNHGVILDPLETSLAGLVVARRPIWLIANRDNPEFMNLVSRPTQSAIFPKPKDFYVPESNNLNLNQQRGLLAVDEVEVVKQKKGIGGLRLIIGDVATHAGLVFAYCDKTGGRIKLHSADYGHRYGITETPTVGSSNVASVTLHEFRGLRVSSWSVALGNPIVWVVRLGVPTEE